MRRLRFLGAVEIEEAGQSRPFGARKYLSLLALLALNPQRVFARSELAAALWPESDETTGRAALRTALSVLRHEFGADIFVTTQQTVRLAGGVFTTDVAGLEETLRKAKQATHADDARQILQMISQWNRGTLLAGRYEDWIVTERERLTAAVEAAIARCEALLRMEQHTAPRPKSEGPAFLRLPQFNSRFLGRETEMNSLAALLTTSEVRTVTLTGVGGIGKTRLAVEIARRLASQFTGAVCFVPLETLTDGNDILPAVAAALRSDHQAASDLESMLARRLQEWGSSLLILDNLEQMVANGAARAIRTLLSVAPNLRLLITSRQVIGCEGERIFPVRSLSASDNRALFVEQAQAVSPEFTVSEQNQATIEELCDHLDGIPLAIELCASWAAVLTPQQMNVRMADRFALLKSRRQDIDDRHRSLRAALEWGIPTDPALLQFFLSLSVFRGGFTLDAAEVVAGNDALENLAALQERSLIVAEQQDNGEMRYRLMETIREFADEKLSDAERLTAQRRHLAHYSRQSLALTEPLMGADAAKYFAALDHENPNFRAAIEFGLQNASAQLEMARMMINHLGWYWAVRGHQMPQKRWLDTLFARYRDLPEEAQPWELVTQSGRVPTGAAEPLLQQARAEFERQGNLDGVSHVLRRFSDICFERCDPDGMRSYALQAAEYREKLGDIRGAGYVLAHLAGYYFHMCLVPEARALWVRCREIARQIDDIGSIAVLDRAEGHALVSEGKPEEAIAFYEKALQTFRHKQETWHIMDTLHRFGEALLQCQRMNEASAVFQEALQFAEAANDFDRAAIIRKIINEFPQKNIS